MKKVSLSLSVCALVVPVAELDAYADESFSVNRCIVAWPPDPFVPALLDPGVFELELFEKNVSLADSAKIDKVSAKSSS